MHDSASMIDSADSSAAMRARTELSSLRPSRPTIPRAGMRATATTATDFRTATNMATTIRTDSARPGSTITAETKIRK